MKRWEYMTVHVETGKPDVLVDKLGAEGWEMVCVLTIRPGKAWTFYFKRELPPEAEQPGHVLTKQPEAGYMFPRKNRKEP